jgi:hypothetical protein
MKKGGSAVAGPIWNKFMNEALKILPSESFEAPNLEIDPTQVKPALRGEWMGNENFFIDKISGKLATENTPKETLEEKVITNVHTILYWVDKKDILGPSPTNPTDDPQFNHWEIPIQNWWAQNKNKYPQITPGDKPIGVDNIHTSSSRPAVTILEPDSTTEYLPDQKIYLKITNSSRTPLLKIDIFVNDIYLETRESPFFNYYFVPNEIQNIQAFNKIKIISYDTLFNRSETTSTFAVKQ